MALTKGVSFGWLLWFLLFKEFFYKFNIDLYKIV